MEYVDKSIIKRNYFYIIYNILKDETSKDKHLSIKEICDVISERYDLKIDKNTVGRVFEDLIAFGYDIKKDENGYYLDRRVFTDAEMGLLIDGIESINVLSADSKIEIYEKICKINGKSPESIDYYLYEQEEYFENEELLSIIEIIYEAIGNNKKLDVYYPFGFLVTVLDQLTPQEIEELKQSSFFELGYYINPYQIFRSRENKIFLLYYYKLSTRFVIGAINLASIESYWLFLTEKDRDKIDISLLLSKNLTDFISARDYSEGEMLLTAVIIPANANDDKRIDFTFILDKCESFDVVEENGIRKYKINYKHKNEEEIIKLCLELYEYVRVLKGNVLYDKLKEVLNCMKYIINEK